MNIQQLYNQSAMLRDSFASNSNSTSKEDLKKKFEQIAKEQQSISETLKVIMENTNTS